MSKLTMLQLCKRTKALDAHYLNADRWLFWYQQTIDPAERRDAFTRWQEAEREYIRLRDTPYRIADDHLHV